MDVTSTEHQDQLALDYAVWHLTAMTPAHDERSSIAAKGLTGEGYNTLSDLYGVMNRDTPVFRGKAAVAGG